MAEALNGSVVEDLLIHSIRIDVSEAGVLEASQMVRDAWPRTSNGECSGGLR